MKFLTLENGQLGVLIDRTVVDVVAAADSLQVQLPATTVAELVEAGDDAAGTVNSIAEQARAQNIACRAYTVVSPMAPIPIPKRNILCMGKNYLEHAQEVAAKMKASAEAPAKPIIFTKATTSVTGPNDPIPSYPELTSKLDYEAELALILGKGGRDITRENAWSHVFGYTIINDISARDLQKDHFQWFRAKSLDGFSPMGPIVVHRSVMPPLDEIRVQCHINGEERQNDTFNNLIFDVPEIISVMSAGMTLVPGDIIATGTPAGVGMGFRPSKYLKVGDEVVVSVTGAGELRNSVV